MLVMCLPRRCLMFLKGHWTSPQEALRSGSVPHPLLHLLQGLCLQEPASQPLHKTLYKWAAKALDAQLDKLGIGCEYMMQSSRVSIALTFCQHALEGYVCLATVSSICSPGGLCA